MIKNLRIIDNHECKPLQKYNSGLQKQEIEIQMFDDMNWYWVRWDDRRGNTAEGIAYCPYCGEKLKS